MPMPFTAEARADLAYCQRLLRGGSRSFWLASRLLPASVLAPACAVYAFCRLADDDIDADGAGEQALLHWRGRLSQVYEGRPHDHPVDRALARVVQAHALPQALPEALLEGFAWDLAGRRYDQLEDLTAYAARVAGSVGAMMAVLMGARSEVALARACDLGVAMQLTNIARDVGEDARAGRLYLPLQWMRDEGLDPNAWLVCPAHSPALARVVQRLLQHADALYARADAGMACLPRRCRPGIRLARYLYAGIGDEVARRGHDAVSSRAVVPVAAKIRALKQALVGSSNPPSSALAVDPPLPQTAYLVAAARRPAQPRAVPSWRLDLRWLAALELMARVDARRGLPRPMR